MIGKIKEMEKIYFYLIDLEIKSIAGDNLSKRINLQQSDKYFEELDNFFDDKARKLKIEDYASREEVLNEMNNSDLNDYLEYLKDKCLDKILNLDIKEDKILEYIKSI